MGRNDCHSYLPGRNHGKEYHVFLKGVYEGSSGAIYPHAVIEKISDEKTAK